MLQFSPYANKDNFEESFEDEDNGIVIPETQMNNLESDDDEDNGAVIQETQMNNLESDYNNQQMLDEGCMICKCDDNHNKLLLCEGCNGEYHPYCLHPPLHLVLEYDFFCEKCKEAGKDDGMLESTKNYQVITVTDLVTLYGLMKVRDMDIG
jgi:hypothetical protein